MASVSGAIIGAGDRKSGVHEVTSKKPNVLFLEQTAPPSTSQTRAGTFKFAGISGDGRSSCHFIWVLSQLWQALNNISIYDGCTLEE